MQDTDSSVRIECAFEASEQTITYSAGRLRDGSDYMGPEASILRKSIFCPHQFTLL